jgi:hypothetical protein
VSVSFAVDGAGLVAMLCGGTKAADDLLLLCDRVYQKVACCLNHVVVITLGSQILGEVSMGGYLPTSLIVLL